jgi:hypothetical protein
MEKIFEDWLRSERSAREDKAQVDTLVLTWTPIISRLTALRILVLGRRRGRINIATVKVLDTLGGHVLLKVFQQPDFETTEVELMDSLGKGRSAGLDPHLESLKTN